MSVNPPTNNTTTKNKNKTGPSLPPGTLPPGVTGPGGTSGPAKNNAQLAYNFLIGKGLSDAAASGILGNLMIESSLNPGAVGDNGSSFGIAQWHAGRADAMKSWITSHGGDPSTIDGQLQYLWHELQTSYSQVYYQVSHASTPSSAAGYFAAGYERPASTDYSNREAAATAIAGAAATGKWNSVGASTATAVGGVMGGVSASSGLTQLQQQAKQRQIQDYTASFENMLQQWGIQTDGAMKSLISQAAQQGLNESVFINELRQTKEYAQAFPGNMKADGTLRMSESQFLSGYNSARDYAAQVGRNLSLDMYGAAIKNDNSPSEIKAKLQAVNTLQHSAPLFQQFSDYLQQTGVEKKPLQRQDMLNFIMGQGPQQWTDAWQAASTAAQVEAAGISVGKHSDVSWQQLKHLMNRSTTGDLSQVNWQQLSDAVKMLPQDILYGAGITKKDLLKMSFGGPKAQQIAQRTQQVMAQYEARFQPQANPQIVQTATGTRMLGGQPQVQASE